MRAVRRLKLLWQGRRTALPRLRNTAYRLELDATEGDHRARADGTAPAFCIRRALHSRGRAASGGRRRARVRPKWPPIWHNSPLKSLVVVDTSEGEDTLPPARHRHAPMLSRSSPESGEGRHSRPPPCPLLRRLLRRFVVARSRRSANMNTEHLANIRAGLEWCWQSRRFRTGGQVDQCRGAPVPRILAAGRNAGSGASVRCASLTRRSAAPSGR